MQMEKKKSLFYETGKNQKELCFHKMASMYQTEILVTMITSYHLIGEKSVISGF